MKVIEFLEAFEAKQKEKKSINTVSSYMSDLKKFNQYLNSQGIRFDDINNKIIDNYINALIVLVNKRTGKTLAPETINRHLVSIRLFVDFVNLQEEFEDKIFIEINNLKIQRQYYLENLLEKSEFERMISKAKQDKNEKAYTIFTTLYYTGARVSEMLQMIPQHINDDNLVIKGKGNKFREIILADDVIDILNRYIKKNNIIPNQRIFPMTRQNVHYIIKKYAGKCRINLKHASAHKFRHLHALELLDADATLEEVADDLGHTNINTTRIYTKKSKKELKKTVNRLSNQGLQGLKKR